MADDKDALEHLLSRPLLDVASSVSGRRWTDRLVPGGHSIALAMAQRAGLPEVVARILTARGVVPEAATAYLEPSLKTLMPDPSVLTDMDAAASRLADAVERGEKLAIFGDYDVDGATSVALLGRLLTALGLCPLIYIPDRLIDGYGPHPRAIADLAAEGTTLLVTVDCGTQSFEAFEGAAQAGMDVVVLDHHQASIALPQVCALVNPNRQDDLSGLTYLAAVGVTFLAAVALNRELRRRSWYARQGREEVDLFSLLDLVALGTVCDVVPLQGLNRAYVMRGLHIMRERRNPGLVALADVARLNGPPTPYHLGFMLGPRINAGGRIGDAALGARLLLNDDPAESARIAAALDRLNRERQALEMEALEEAEAMIAQEMAEKEPAVLVVASERWHPGIIGLIAARLKERYNRPAFALALNADGTATGSGRSIMGADLGATVRYAVTEGILLKGGGHMMAAGLTMAAGRIPDFAAFLRERLAEAVTHARKETALKIDALLSVGGATVSLIEAVERAGPFGAGQPEPVFAFPSHRILYAEGIGEAHVRVQLAASDGSRLKAIAFRARGRPLGDFLLQSRDRVVHVAGVLGLDHYQGAPKPQLRILDAADPLTSRGD